MPQIFFFALRAFCFFHCAGLWLRPATYRQQAKPKKYFRASRLVPAPSAKCEPKKTKQFFFVWRFALRACAFCQMRAEKEKPKTILFVLPTCEPKKKSHKKK
jgi:hypothetical protein